MEDIFMKFAVRKWLSALIDFIIDIAVMGLFYTGARGYVADGDVGKGNIMLICALLAIVFLTCYVPYKQGQTVGQAIFKVKVINKDDSKRTMMQILLRECIMKFLFGPLFLVLSAGYFLINNVIMLKDYNVPLPHDAILKTEVIDLSKN
ncbi:MAG TPA: hypothetical protein DHV77_09640 [Erysipelotrichaceae bacterium]|nr:hypothetical protein [Erysipelotrichaceae bacterium]HCJ15342.1 hypothetical protein [Erysipelotrichaceae bacterium]